MKTITISVQSTWINEDAQRDLESDLADLDYIEDFVFNEDGDLKVTFEEPIQEGFIRNLCGLKIQYAIRKSTKSENQ